MPMPILSARVNLNKRHTPAQQKARRDAASIALCRVYCDVIGLWRGCAKKSCRRHRHCRGDPWPCLQRGRSGVPRGLYYRIEGEVRLGGPRRVPPLNNIEWTMRQDPPGWLK
jgi:hypothetical protein